jgi:hypothetical protein
VNLAGWPVRPVLAVDTGAGWIDATCDLYGFTLKVGPADDHFDWPPAELHVQLDNRRGAWSRINPDGTLSTFGPGTRLALWAHYPTGDDEWIMFGQATAWNQAGEVVEVTAFDMLATLAQPIGPFTAGTAGQQPGARSTAIVAATGRAIPQRFDAGVVQLTAQETKQAPLEDLQAVAASDGGVVLVDADGTVITFGRDWRRGRTDQTSVLTVSDNVCTADAVIWEPTFTIDDHGYAGYVVLSTVAGLKAAAGNPTAPFVYAESDLQFASATEGNSVAAALLAHLSRPLATLDHFDVHVLDPHQPRLAELVALRPLDRIGWTHTELAVGGGTVTLTGTALAVGIEHAMSPSSGWSLTVDTLAADDIITLIYWDQADPYTWDDPRVVWS